MINWDANRRLFALLCGLAATGGTVACSQRSDLEDYESKAPPLAIGDVSAPLHLYDTGAGVAAVNHYLFRYGYYPNAALAQQFPTWRPLVSEAPVDPYIFDATTEEAVKKFQSNMGLKSTGVVDTETLKLMKTRRCGHPDRELQDESEKWALYSQSWSDLTLKYKVVPQSGNTTLGTGNLTQATVETVLASAFAEWAATTTLSFSKTSGSDNDIEITWFAGSGPAGYADFDGPGDIMAWGHGPTDGRLYFDDDETWSTTNLEDVAVHEIGHVLGLAHSSLASATMYPFVHTGMDSVESDDIEGIGARYNAWELMPGSATQVSVGADGTVWILGDSPITGGFATYQWNGSSWTAKGGAGVRIAVGPSGLPWLVNSSGNVYERSGGSWVSRSGAGTDISVGADGSVWLLGNTPVSGGYSTYKWNGSAFSLVAGAARDIGVDPNGQPWVTTSAGAVYRRPSSSWNLMPGAGTDIAVGANGAVWMLGNDADTSGNYAVYLWNEQTAFDTAPAKAEWVNVPGGATSIAVDPNGLPWVTNSAHEIYRRKRQ